MAEFKSEVMKALPHFNEEAVNQLMMQLYGLGVENSQDMTLLKEDDLKGFLKVIPCRKLLNYFNDVRSRNEAWPSQLASFAQNRTSWVPSPSVMNTPIQESQPYSQTSTSSSTTMQGYVNPFRGLPSDVKSRHNSFAPSSAHGSSVQSETMNSFPVQNNTVMSNADFPTFKVSAPFTCSMSEPTSTSEEHCSASQNFVTSTDNRAPLSVEGDARESTPTPLKASTEATILEATNSIKRQNVSDDESFGGESSASCEKSYKTTSKKKRSTQNSEFSASDYELPLHKLPDDIRRILENKEQIDKTSTYMFVRVIVDSLSEEHPNLTAIEMASIAKAVVDAYPDSLNQITSGKNSTPGYESLEKMIYNRFNNVKHNLCEGAVVKRPIGRPKGLRNSRTSETEGAHIYNSSLSSETVHNVYQVTLQELPRDIEDCFKHDRPLNEAQIRKLIEIIVDDLLKRNSNLTHDALKLVAEATVLSYPGLLKLGKDKNTTENFIFQKLNEEIKKRNLKTENLGREQPSSSSCSNNLMNEDPNLKKRVTVDLSSSVVKNYIPFERWNKLRYYKIPLDKLPSTIRDNLTNGVLIENAMQEELAEIIIQDALLIVPRPTREDIKIIGKACANAYPNSLQSNVKFNRFKYLTFLKKLMEVGANVTGDNSLNFRTVSYTKKRNVQKRVCNKNDDDEDDGDDDDGNFGISKAEMRHFKSLKQGLQTQSGKEEWNNYISGVMNTTYPLQRLEISDGISLEELKMAWPFLFHEKGLLQHLRLLLKFCLSKRMEQNLRDKHNMLFNFFVNENFKQEKMEEIISEMHNNPDNRNRRILLLILEYFEENQLDILFTFQNQRDKVDLSHLPTDPCIISHVGSSPAERTFSVCMERTVLVSDIPFTTAFVIYFGTYLMFNLSYPPSLIHSLEFIQRCFAEIPMRPYQPVPNDVSKKVDILLKNTQLIN